MDDNLNKDPFEDFLRKSLENHSEIPSENTWEKIAAQRSIDLAAPPSPRSYWRAWAMAASVALLLSALLGQHFYFSEKIEKLEATVQSLPKAAEDTAPQKSDKTDLAELEVPHSNTIQAINPTSTHTDIEKKLHQTVSEKARKPQLSLAADHPSKASVISKKIRTTVEENGLSVPAEQTKTEELVEVLDAVAQIEKQPSAGKEEWVLLENGQFGTLTGLQQKSFVALQGKDFPSKKAFVPPLVPAKYKAIVEISAVAGQNQIQTERNVRQLGSSPSRDHDFRSVKRSIVGIQTGMLANVHLTKKMRLRTGLALENISVNQRFMPKLKYEDGHHSGHGGSGNDDEHDFSFYLNSGTSELDVVVRAEDLAQGTNWSPDDDIVFEIETTRKQQSYFIPLQLGYEVRKGRWSAGLYAGPSFQAIKTDEMALSNININDARLEIKPDKTQHKQDKNAQSTVLINGAVGLNLRYAISPKLSIGIEPSYSKSMLSDDITTTRTGLFGSISYTL